MPNTTIQYQLEARSSLAATMKADADAARQLASSTDVTFKQLTANLNASTRASAELRREIAQGESAAKSSAGAHDGLFKSIAGGTIVGNLAASAIRDVAASLVDMGKGALENAANLQSSNIAFTQLLGSATQAKAEIQDLQAFAAKTPFNFADVRNYALQLQGTGTAAKQVIPVLTDLGNAVAASGGGNDRLQRVVLAYEQIQAKGHLAGGEAKQLAENLVPVWDILAKQLGVTAAKVQDMSEKGQITADIFDKAFHNEAVARWGGMMDAASKSAQGIVSNLQDMWEQLSGSLAGPALEVLDKELLKFVTDLSRPETAATIADWGDKFGRAADGAFKLWDTFSQGARAALAVVRPVTDAIGQLLGSLPAVQADPIQPMARSAATLGDNLKIASVATVDYKGNIQAAQDVLENMRQADQDRNYALDSEIENQKRKLSVLQEQWQVQDRATSVARLAARIAKDSLLAKDIYSSGGQNAAKRLVDERQQLEDMQTQQTRDGEKARLSAGIQGLEDSKKAQDHAAQLRERAQQDRINAAQRAEAADKAAADTAAAAQAEWSKRIKATTDEYRAMYDYTGRAGPTLKTQTGEQTGVLSDLNKQLQAALTWGGKISDLWKGDITSSFGSAGTALSDLLDTGNRVAELFGNKGGLGEVLATNLKNSMGKVTVILNDTTDGMRKVALAAALLKDLTGGGHDFQDTIAAFKDVYENNQLTKLGQQLGAPVDKFLGTTGGSLPLSPNATSADLPRTPTFFNPDDINPRHRAGGGPVSPATGPFLVGERGPEIFQPSTSGQIIPNGSYGGNDTIRLEISHLCPSCLQSTVQTIMKRQGSKVIGNRLMGAMG